MAEETKPTEEQAIDQLVTEQPTEAAKAEPEAEAPETTPEAKPEEQQADKAEQPKAHNFDKGLQKLQQEQANLKRELDKRFNEILETIKSQGGVATQAQRQEAQKLAQAQQDLDAATDPEKGDPYKASKLLAEELKSVKAQLAEYKAAIDGTRQQVQSVSESQQRANFITSNPDIGPQYDSLVETAVQQMQEIAKVRGPARTQEQHDERASWVWEKVVSEAKAKASAATKKPLSKEPEKSTVGTKAVSTGSTARLSPSQKQKTQDELIDDLVLPTK